MQTKEIDLSAPENAQLRDSLALVRYRLKPLPEQLGHLIKGFAVEAVDSDPLITVAARILDRVHVALSRRDIGTLTAWEGKMYDYAPDSHLLPPRAGRSRADAVRKLVAAAKADIDGDRPPSVLGPSMADAVVAYFSNLAAAARRPHEELGARIGDAWADLCDSGRRDPEALAVEALVAFGVSRRVARNWIKGADRP